LRCNRILLIGASLLMLVIACVVLSQTAIMFDDNVLFTAIFREGRNASKLLKAFAGLLMMNCTIGFAAGFFKWREVVKVFLIAQHFLIIFAIVCVLILSTVGNQNSLQVDQGDLKEGWIQVMQAIADGKDPESKFFDFISTIQEEGSCCGFDSSVDILQNPPKAQCSFQGDSCQVFVTDKISSESELFFQSFLASFAIVVACTFSLVFFVVRIVTQPLHHEDAGAFYYI